MTRCNLSSSLIFSNNIHRSPASHCCASYGCAPDRALGSRDRRSHAGFTTLVAALATFAGIVFVLLMANVTRIISAKDALDQSLRRGSRCLTPTDGDCAAYSGGTTSTQATPTHYQLFTPDTKNVVDTYEYRAAFERNTWQGSYNSYLVHIVSPQLRYSSIDAPLMSYNAPYNAYENVFARVKACGERISGPITPHNRSAADRARVYFPSFYLGTGAAGDDPLSERSQVDNESYHPYCPAASGSSECCPIDRLGTSACPELIALPGVDNLANNPGNTGIFDFRQNTSHGGDHPPANTTHGCDHDNHCGAILNPGDNAILDATITLPPAPAAFANPNIPCRAGHDNRNQPVSCNSAMESMTGGGNVQTNAHIAWRVTAEVCRFDGNSAQIGWGLGLIIPGNPQDQNQDGIVDHGGSHNGDTNQGGRDSVLLPHNMAECKWIGVWLRGPASAHGGDTDWTHDNIEVPWGSTFRARGWVRNTATDPTDRLIIRQVKFQVYSDLYDNPTTQSDCRWCNGDYQQLPASGVEGPSNLASCGFSAAEGWVARSSGNGRYEPVAWSLTPNDQGYLTRVTPSCSSSGTTFPVALRDPATSSCARSGVMCSAAQSPSIAPDASCGSAPTNRQYCGWQGTRIGTQTVGSVQACVANQNERLATISNAPYRSDSNYADPMTIAQFAALQSHSDQVNANQPAGFPAVGHTPAGEVRWISNEIVGPSLHPSHPQNVGQSNQHFDYSWTPVRSATTCSCQAVGSCAVESCTIPNYKHTVQYQRVDPNWRPDFALFNISAPESSNLVLGYNSNPPDGFLSDAYVSRTRTGIDFEDRVTAGYPFANVVQHGFAYEIPYWGQDSCNTGCTVDYPRGFTTLPAALREYVRRNSSETHRALAADSTIYLDAQAPVHQLAVETTVAVSMPECTPQRTQISHRFVGEQFDDQGVCANGGYPRWQDKTEERYVCNGSSLLGFEHGGCVSGLGDVTVHNDPVQGNYDIQRATAVSAAELRRMDEGVVLGCSNGGSGSCVDYNFDTTSEPGFANVHATYRVPVSFPLSTLIGQDSVTVESDKREPFEMQVAGVN